MVCRACRQSYLGSIQDVEIEVMLTAFWEHLHSEIPLRKNAIVNCFIEILAMEVGVLHEVSLGREDQGTTLDLLDRQA